MEKINKIFDRIHKLTHEEIDELSSEIQKDETILISVKNQKLLRSCFQLITSLGFSSCLIPGLGLSLTKRCSSAVMLPSLSLTDEQKYKLLVDCADFFERCYKVPVLKNIIVTFHLSDYLAALIQLSFAPLKKPGTYRNFTMTQDMYDQLNKDRQRYVRIYEHLIANCFQPILMKELLVLQSVNDPPPPVFVRRVIAKEMSRRLLVPGGLLSLIRCFIENYNIDTAFQWKKIDMICKIVIAKHGNDTEENYLGNICSQLFKILALNDTHYLATAVACILRLLERYPQSNSVKALTTEISQAFDYDYLASQSDLPGTIILSPQELEHKVNILHACLYSTKLDWPTNLMMPNLQVLLLLGIKCINKEELSTKIKGIVLKCLEQLNKSDMHAIIKKYLFGNFKLSQIAIEEFESGLTIKCMQFRENYAKSDIAMYFLTLFKASTNSVFVQNVFEACSMILIELSSIRRQKRNEILYNHEDDIVLFNDTDENYANILQLLSEMSTTPKLVSTLRANPIIVLPFIEHFISNTKNNSNDECVTIALVVLNTILSNTIRDKDLEHRLQNLIPVLKGISQNESDLMNLLCNEALSLISSEEKHTKETSCSKAIAHVFDNLLPVRAHGIIELTKLIDAKDPETISKKHYIFCLFQEQLKEQDSYIYLSAVSGMASLGTHCTEDVLQILCKEFLQGPTEQDSIVTNEDQNRAAELRMKVGDIIVKVTKRLGEMAILHKTLLLNTILTGCRDKDPLIRMSALSNLAEIALVLHYRIGSIIYEVLLCIWSVIESDKAIECRRAAVMVISSLLKGLGKETLMQLKDNLLPIYRTLKKLYRDENEDSVVRLHSQIALDELNNIVRESLPDLKMEKHIFVLDKPEDVFK
ncbi:transport and Golgi organization protein 6 isoform X2 [Hyposmocoma kahamanoa]|uniref:transport and Golgi organization protein 6 isoform X2 n=1 Tax=Hyposmocoma kahamanoa TaxID=1477025 RepID=UPI000E6D95B4|nr:transport and Golgi organization protein 6 isoform X2 [Hyposmocoma kahamanoa]